MKRILIVCAALLLCGMAAARGRGVHRVVSCNIRVALPQDEEGGNGWSVRKYVCERVMKRCKADIYCLQEVTVGQYEDTVSYTHRTLPTNREAKRISIACRR